MSMHPSKFSTIAIVSTLTLPLLSGCIDTSLTTQTTESSSTVQYSTDIVAERGPLLNAAIQDATGQRATSIGNGVYQFSGEISYPIETTGGIIDLNHNGVIDEGDIKTNGIKLKANSGKVVTIATTLATNDSLKQKMISGLNLSEDAIQNETPTTHKGIAALSDEVFKYCIENNITDAATLTDEQWSSIAMHIQNRIDLYTNSPQTAADLEQDLVTNELSGRVLPLLPTDADNLNREKTDRNPLGTTLASLPTYALNDAQKQALVYLWNEEKMAKDLYLALNNLYPSNTLENIATKAETDHQFTMESLLQKYNIDVTHYNDVTYGYSQTVLDSYAAGTYADANIKSLYDTLYSVGATSAQASLEVGCKVEVTDIDDLTKDIEIAGEAQDLKMVFENLRRGSYNHYWAFDNALKKQGVVEGCCSLGADFCHPEYPAHRQGQDQQGMGNDSEMNNSRGMHSSNDFTNP